MNEEIMTNEVAAEVNENPVVETQSTEVTTEENEVKSLGKDLAEMAVVGLVIYAFCKLVDWLVDKAKAGIAKIKAKRAEKKAQKAAQAQQQAPAQQGPVANVNVETPADGQTTEQK